MKLIIDIDDNVFTRLFDNGVDTSSDDREVIDRAVRNGKPYEERPQGEWIPVSERLPDSAGYYCVTVKNGNDTYVTEEMWSSNFQGNNGFHNYLPVIAWCPLPEPYKETEND